MMNEVQVA